MSYAKIYYNGQVWDVLGHEIGYDSISHGPKLTLKCTQARTDHFDASDFNDAACYAHQIMSEYNADLEKNLSRTAYLFGCLPKIKKVIFNDPATIVFWADKTKTVVKAYEDKFDPEKGLTMAITKKALGNQGNYYNEIRKWVDTYYEEYEEERDSYNLSEMLQINIQSNKFLKSMNF